MRDVGLRRAFGIGCAQALALVPGTSRSGITVSAGLFTGLDRPTAARFAFLLGLPLTAGVGLVKAAALARHGLGAEALPVAVGLVAAFASGLAAVWLLIRFLQRRTLVVFVVYRLALGLAILGLLAMGVRL
jgi:undecaprenyl-diphosphatase